MEGLLLYPGGDHLPVIQACLLHNDWLLSSMRFINSLFPSPRWTMKKITLGEFSWEKTPLFLQNFSSLSSSSSSSSSVDKALFDYIGLTHWGLVTPYGIRGCLSILVQVMACCLMASSNYQNQCWLIIIKVLWHSSEGMVMKKNQ